MTIDDDTRKRALQVVAAFHKMGVTNKFLIAGALAVMSKESEIKAVTEKSYRSTDPDRIRAIFSRFSSWSDAELNRLKVDDDKFFDEVYGHLNGNSQPGDGYKYRGSGYIQLTGRGNFARYGKLTGHDLVARPQLLQTDAVAAAVSAAYIKHSMEHAPDQRKLDYKFTTVNSFKTLKDATMAAYHATAGWGKTRAYIITDKVGGLAKALARAPGFLSMLEGRESALGRPGGNNGLAVAALAAIGLLAMARRASS
jgi:predicted chitinase